jgi:hypothetical protein
MRPTLNIVDPTLNEPPDTMEVFTEHELSKEALSRTDKPEPKYAVAAQELTDPIRTRPVRETELPDLTLPPIDAPPEIVAFEMTLKIGPDTKQLELTDRHDCT